MRIRNRYLPLLSCLLLVLPASLNSAPASPTDSNSAPLVGDMDDLKNLERQLMSVADLTTAATVSLVPINGDVSGSGVVVSPDGLILTAAHVLKSVGEEAIVIFPNGKRAKAKALGADFERDAGMLQITDSGKYPFVQTAPSELPPIHSWCVATGHPGKFDSLRTPPIRLGRVLHHAKFLLTNCAVVSGDSGGPLFDLEGRVIGIHANVGIAADDNRHVPIKVFHDQWDDLLAGKRNAGGNDLKLDGNHADEDLDAFLDRSFREAKDGKLELKLTPEMIEQFGGMEKIKERIQAKLAESAGGTEKPEADEKSEPEPPKSDKELVELVQRLRKEMKANGDRFMVDPDDLKALGGMQKLMERLKSTPDSPDEALLSALKALTPLTKEVSLTVVTILADDKQVALGTVVAADGYILTKNSETENGSISVRISNDVFSAVLVERFPEWDLALFNIPVKGLRPIKFASDDSAVPARGALVTLPGSAGEPLGLGVVGVATRRLSHIGFAGIEADMSASSAGRMLVSSTVGNGPAANAGVKAKDVITMINGQPVTDPFGFTRTITSMKAGDTVALGIERDGKKFTLDILLGEFPLEKPNEVFLEVNRLSCSLSPMIDGFPLALQHDIPLKPSQCGGPLMDMEGRCIGINVSRSGRVSTLAIPASGVAGLLASSRPGNHAAGNKVDEVSPH